MAVQRAGYSERKSDYLRAAEMVATTVPQKAGQKAAQTEQLLAVQTVGNSERDSES